MKFHLNHTPKKSPFYLDHKSTVLLVGSCFAENIGTFLKDHKFKTLVNPDGILFNPLSIYNSLKSTLLDQQINENVILQREGVFYSFLHHSSHSSVSKNELIGQLNAVTHSTHQFLKTTNTLILTFGTAFVYYHKKLSQVVANCQKQPVFTFDKKLLEVEEIISAYSLLIKDLKILNPDLKIIFTVSPVKYLKDGVEENTISKSTLLLSVHKLIALHQNCYYFPAFELINDDLRDYRFYKEDLAHPNQPAIEYIWQKFSECYFNSKTIELNQQIHKLNQALNHRQMQENSTENEKLKAFIAKQRIEIKKLDSSIEI